MTLEPLDALERCGTLYVAQSRTSDVVHVSESCANTCAQMGLRDTTNGQRTMSIKVVKHPPQIPLRTAVCDYCDPTTEADPR